MNYALTILLSIAIGTASALAKAEETEKNPKCILSVSDEANFVRLTKVEDRKFEIYEAKSGAFTASVVFASDFGTWNASLHSSQAEPPSPGRGASRTKRLLLVSARGILLQANNQLALEYNISGNRADTIAQLVCNFAAY